MANLGRVRPADLAYDPYCGTAGTLVAAGAFGAFVLGCDLSAPAIRGRLRTRSVKSARKQPADSGIVQTFVEYGLPPPIDRIHGDSGAHLRFLRSPRGGGGEALFDVILTDPPYGIRERPSEVDDAALLTRAMPAEHLVDHVPRCALAALEQILSDLFSLAAATLRVGGRLVFLLPCTEPFAASLLPPHEGLQLESACEQPMAARWSRWCVVMVRTDATATAAPDATAVKYAGTSSWQGAAGAADGAAAAASGTAAAVGGESEAGGARAPIFNRASLRPDDLNSAGRPAAATAAATAVLHPHLLGKSSGARRRLESRLERVAADAAAAAGGGGNEGCGGGEGGEGAPVGYGNLRGASKRAVRRQARNEGRQAYATRVRDGLAQMGAAHHEAAGTTWGRVRTLGAALAIGSIIILVTAAAARRAKR